MRKSLFFRIRALAGLSGRMRHREGCTPFTIHPKAAVPKSFRIYGRSELSIDAPIGWIGLYKIHTKNYKIPLELVDENGESVRPAISIAQPLCRVEGYATDELDLVGRRLFSRTKAIKFSDYSETVSLYGTVNGRSIFRIPLSPIARPMPEAAFSNGLTPCADLATLSQTEFGCMIGEDGTELLFTLSDETPTLEAMQENLRMTDLELVYVRDVEEISSCNFALPTLPSPACTVRMYDGLQADVSIDYDPVMQGG